jgi:hypothetical protein
MNLGTGTPEVDGLYVAEVYWGWRTLAWFSGVWNYHYDMTSPWAAGDPVQWIGPLPERLGGTTPPPLIISPPPALEFDL